MPPRRTSRRIAMPTALQSKLSFHGSNQNKVTKASYAPENVKSAKGKEQALLESLSQSDHISEPDLEPTTADHAIHQQAESEASTLATSRNNVLASPRASQPLETLGGRADTQEVGKISNESGLDWLGDEGKQARQISSSQINRYWRSKEAERLAPRVHQDELSIHEKILREWDMSGQYGPCIGISRLKRWKRANMLRLKPPMEVLAVLLKEMDGGDVRRSQRAHVDELMSSRFIET